MLRHIMMGTFVALLAAPSVAEVECSAGGLADERWAADGPFQGFWVAHVTNGSENEIHMSCDIGSGSGSMAMICLNGTHPIEPIITVQVDDRPPYEMTMNHFHGGSFTLKGGLTLSADQDFERLVEDMRRGSTIQVTDAASNSSTFTLGGSSTALYDCPPILR